MSVRVLLDRDSEGQAFEAAMRNQVKVGDEVLFITKSKGTKEGQPAVMVMFKCQLPDESWILVRAIMTGREFSGVADAVCGAHPGLSERVDSKETSRGSFVSKYDGVGYNAVFLEEVYLVHVEGSEGILIASTADEVHAMAKHEIDRQIVGGGTGQDETG